ncbi:MAG: imelysin family protein [Planctomycetota bacterium]
MTTRSRISSLRFSTPLLLLLPLSCSSGSDRKAELAQHYVEVLHATYTDAEAGAEELDQAITAFCDAPSASGLEHCREVWIQARLSYQQTEISRFYEGPIDRAPDGPEGFINAWPVDESHLRAIIADATAFPTIDATTLREANESGGEENIATGWHAIEYLLWGEDLRSDGPGERDWQDFQDGGPLPHPDRRRQVLRVASGILVADLRQVRLEWENAYRDEFLAAGADESLRRILTGVGTLVKGELYGERLVVPWSSKSQGDEHSCFADTTHLDHLHDMIGVRNAWTGSFRSERDDRLLEGPGLRDLARGADAARADRIDALIERAIRLMESRAFRPFDQAILGADNAPGRVAVQEAISALAELSTELTGLADDLDVAVSMELPE